MIVKHNCNCDHVYPEKKLTLDRVNSGLETILLPNLLDTRNLLFSKNLVIYL